MCSGVANRGGRSFVRGAFDGIESHAGRIRVNREHMMGDTVGKVVAVRERHRRSEGSGEGRRDLSG